MGKLEPAEPTGISMGDWGQGAKRVLRLVAANRNFNLLMVAFKFSIRYWYWYWYLRGYTQSRIKCHELDSPNLCCSTLVITRLRTVLECALSFIAAAINGATSLP